MRKIKIALAYDADPIWEIVEGNSELQNVSPVDLPIEMPLIHKIIQWNNLFHDCFENHVFVGFNSDEEKEKFEKLGYEVKRELKAALATFPFLIVE